MKQLNPKQQRFVDELVACRDHREAAERAGYSTRTQVTQQLLAKAHVRAEIERRAPGLLDRVAKNPDASADQLAIAGWLSAFGANKSGWLNLAIEKGLAKGDKRSASFAQRRLAEALLTGGAMDAVLRLTNKPPFSEEKDVAARVFRAGIAGRTRYASAQ